MSAVGTVARLRARLHAFGRRLLAEHTAPGRLAAAAIVGATIGCTPLFGLHLPLCVGAAALLRLNKVTVYAAANISIPPLVPLLGFASVELGERVLRGRWLPLTVEDFRRQGPVALAGRFFADWMLGGVLVGALIGLVMAAVVYGIAAARARRRGRAGAAADPVAAGDPNGPIGAQAPVDAVNAGAAAISGDRMDSSHSSQPPSTTSSTDDAADPIVHRAIRAASDRYRAAPRSMRFYAWFKYRLDPCYRRIAPLVPPGSFTVDLGTGLGMLPVVIALLGEGRRALGVDWDEPKLAAGRLAARDLDGVTLSHGDARGFAIPACDVITIVDVLHYYEADVQREILARAAGALGPGGLLLIREGDAGGGGSRWTRFVEALAVKIGWNRGPRTRFRPIAALAADLEALGFVVTRDEVSGRLHPGNQLLVARAGHRAAHP